MSLSFANHRRLHSTSRAWILGALIVLVVSFAWAQEVPAEPQAEEAGLADLFVEGPIEGQLGSIATVSVPEGFAFTDGDGTRVAMEAMQNPTNGTEVGMLYHIEGGWFVVFEYDPSGYVKDDEKADLDADAILASIQEGTEQANEVRRERGWATLDVVGWAQPPHYDEATNNLEWATKAQSSPENLVINFNSRLLGREGVMSATLVCDPEQLDAVLPDFKSVLASFDYNPGKRYAEYRKGDKLAEYGLAALVTGGAAAVAVKTGLFKKFWKLILVALAGIGGLLRKIFGKKDETAPRTTSST